MLNKGAEERESSMSAEAHTGVFITLMKETGHTDGKSGKAGLAGRISM